MLLKLKALKLHGMAAAFDEVIDEGMKRSRTPFDVLGRLLAAEDSERHARSIRYQMTVAKFPEYRELANFDFAESPVNEQQRRRQEARPARIEVASGSSRRQDAQYPWRGLRHQEHPGAGEGESIVASDGR